MRFGMIALLAMLVSPIANAAEKRMVTDEALPHLRAAISACANHFSKGSNLSVLETRGFKKKGRSGYYAYFKSPIRLIGKAKINARIQTVRHQRGACSVSVDSTLPADGKLLVEETIAAFKRAGFKSATRKTTKGRTERVFVKGKHTHKIDAYARRGSNFNYSIVLVFPHD